MQVTHVSRGLVLITVLFACALSAWAQMTYTVTPSACANGTISPNTAQLVNSGDALPFTATPTTGYGVNTWNVEPVFFSDPLDGTSLDSAWTTYQGAWSEHGVLSQTDSITHANTKKASVTNERSLLPRRHLRDGENPRERVGARRWVLFCRRRLDEQSRERRGV